MKIQLANKRVEREGVRYAYPPYDGVMSVRLEGHVFEADDIVVAGGHIGNIEGVDIEEKTVHLGLSYEYDKCMADPEDWEMFSGHQCSYNGIRHATREEIRKYEISAGLTCDAAEMADIAYKEKRIW